MGDTGRNHGSGRTRGAVLWMAATGLLVAALGGFSYWFFTCPCERMPGGYLLGETVAEPVADWGFANRVPLCQIQINGGILPHAINLNCMATRQGELYLSCSDCDGKHWSSVVMRDPGARIRLEGMVYPVNVTRVTDPAEMDRAWGARLEKLASVGGPGNPAPPGDTPRPDGWWTFRVESAR